MKKLITALSLAGVAIAASAQNPYMPLWEYIPDGEPYVFEDPDCPGKYRIYVYGSHDDLIREYCGRDQVVWSAPIDDLSNWRYDGTIFVSDKNANGEAFRGGRADVLYAPDIAVKTDENGKKKYYLYPNNQSGGRQSMIAVSDRPDGPFTVTNWSRTNPNATDGVLGFDPAVFVDDDGRVYGYWGFEESNGAELDPVTMASVKPGTQIVKDMVSNYKQDGVFRFFEASSMRKIDGKYVFIYSRYTDDGEFGMPRSNYTLAYAYSDNPLGPFTYGGTIIDARARDIDADGNPIYTAHSGGNTHGSIEYINGQWWVFYHRQTGTDQYSRQAMVAPITVKVQKGKGGKVTISEAEYTSEGFRTEGLNPLYKTPAGWACYYTGPKGMEEKYPNYVYSGSYVYASRITQSVSATAGVTENAGPMATFNFKEPLCPVVNNTSGSVVGYKYFNFKQLRKIAAKRQVKLKMHFAPSGVPGRITVLVGAPTQQQGGVKVAEFRLDGLLDGPAGRGMTPVRRAEAAANDGSGSGRIGSGRVGSGRVGSGRVGETAGAVVNAVGNEAVNPDFSKAMELTGNCEGLKKIKGKQPIYFVFESREMGRSLGDFFDFQFE